MENSKCCCSFLLCMFDAILFLVVSIDFTAILRMTVFYRQWLPNILGSDPTASSREDSNDNLQVIKTTITNAHANNYEKVIQNYFR